MPRQWLLAELLHVREPRERNQRHASSQSSTARFPEAQADNDALAAVVDC